jgi:hypothetical protein
MPRRARGISFFGDQAAISLSMPRCFSIVSMRLNASDGFAVAAIVPGPLPQIVEIPPNLHKGLFNAQAVKVAKDGVLPCHIKKYNAAILSMHPSLHLTLRMK